MRSPSLVTVAALVVLATVLASAHAVADREAKFIWCFSEDQGAPSYASLKCETIEHNIPGIPSGQDLLGGVSAKGGKFTYTPTADYEGFKCVWVSDEGSLMFLKLFRDERDLEMRDCVGSEVGICESDARPGAPCGKFTLKNPVITSYTLYAAGHCTIPGVSAKDKRVEVITIVPETVTVDLSAFK